MKKLLISLAVAGLTFASQAALLRTNLSFINPQIVSIAFTNGMGVTNLLQGYQNGGYWTNGVGNAQALGLGMTNYWVAGSNLMYTQMVVSASASSPSGLLISGTNLPGVLVVVVNTNLNNSLTGVMGIPPFGPANLTWAKTNDVVNLLQDVYFPNDWSPAYGATVMAPLGIQTNLLTSYSAAIEIQTLGSQLAGAANGSNYLTFSFLPIASDGTEIITTQLPAATTYGNFQSLQPFSLNVTNSASTTALCTQIVPIPTQFYYGSVGLRLVSITPGNAWATGGTVWLTRCRLILISGPL